MKHSLQDVCLPNQLIEKSGIFVSNAIAGTTVWDTLAIENPTHAVISATDEAGAAAKSIEQIEHIKSHLTADTILLDYGAGYGRVAKYLLPTMRLGGYIGVDSSYEMLNIFKQRYESEAAEQQTPALFINADIHTVPLKENSVDVVIVCAVFLHNHKEVVRNSMTELARILKPDGTLLVYSSFPNGVSLMGLQGYAYQALLNILGKPFKNGPVRYYTKNEINKLFKDFAAVDIVPAGFVVFPKTIIILPGFLEKIYRIGFAKPINALLEKICPAALKPFFAYHFDIVAKR